MRRVTLKYFVQMRVGPDGAWTGNHTGFFTTPRWYQYSLLSLPDSPLTPVGAACSQVLYAG